MHTQLCRRDVGRRAAAAATPGPSFHFAAGAPGPPRPQGSVGLAKGRADRTLRIAKWMHFLPEYDEWFEGVLAKEWGRRHDTEVIVDRIPIEEIGARAAAEAAAGKGHDGFMFPVPPA